jgi:hypothetical protein
VPGWPGKQVSIPSGLSLSLKEAHARQLQLPYQARSALARASVDGGVAQVPPRRMRVLGEGGSATKDYLHPLPATVTVVSRRLISGKLSTLPPKRTTPRRGCPPKKGPLWGSAKPWARNRSGWQPHPPEAGALGPAWDGLWQAVLPGRLLRRVGVRRPPATRARKPGPRKPLPPVEAFFTTELPRCLEAIRAQYRERWAVEITLRESTACAGFGQDQGRKRERVVGANTWRLVLAATRTLGFLAQLRPAAPLSLQRSRPWYRQTCAPTQLDMLWTWREALLTAGVFPIPRFAPDFAEIPQAPGNTLPLAA